MKDSERLMAIGVAAAAICLVAFLGFRYYSSAVSSRQALIAAQDLELKKQQTQVELAKRASKKMSEYEQRSLPPQPALARSLYQHWLATKGQEAGLHDQVITPGAQRTVQDIYAVQTFTVTGKARYEQIVKFLDDIYRVDLLHRVSKLNLRPVKDSKELELSLTLDAVSVKSAPEAQALHNRPSKRLRLDSPEKYQMSIVGRNIFAPSNRAPRISGLGKQKGTTNRAVDIAAKVSDPDAFDNVKLELTKSSTRDARLDSSGKLSWTPKKAGEYEFEITARDDSFPPHVLTEKLIVTVTDPPEPPPMRDPGPLPEPKLAFDQAKHTVFTAIVGVGDESEVWLFIRPTATLMKLHEGDPFEVGSIKGTIREIGSNEFVFESSAKQTKGQRLLLSRGELLDQAVLMPVETSTDVPVEAPAREEEGKRQSVDDKPADVKPTEELPKEDKPGEGKPAAEKPAPETRAEAKKLPEELQNHEDVVLAAKVPDGFTTLKRDIEIMGRVHGVIFAVAKEGAAAVTITRENRSIEGPARLSITKGYLNGMVAGARDKGWTLKTKEIPKLEEINYDKPFVMQWDFDDADGKPLSVDTTTFFSPQGHMVQILSNNPEDLKLLRAWVATIKPITPAVDASKPAPAANTSPGEPNAAGEAKSPKAE
jgi:hypothetical protein